MPILVTSPLLQLGPMVQSSIGVVILCVLIAAAFYIVASYRDYVAGDQEVASDALANLREMHRKGDITDEEFRTIQARTQQHCTGLTDDARGSDDAKPSTETESPTEPNDPPR
ncbi:hypothetical protein Pla22_02150 [Rubripirellula amarantea]|uniref:SHOCT domain-containing protein n=1 Tax=Rubripirellula amarantea TaxID=2527999 RepID=A0A5C5WR56_9BACT|nr:hypothetical protein [Rubripirellula amarantea]TWT52591.1 hypothetical protein Pla22_02150 [Rubripirellula amarantea]